jgi:hypothetical protein
MNADLTFNSIVFKKSYDKEGQSLRRSTARDINTPDDLMVRSTSYVDSVTKVPGTRYNASVDRYDIDANGTKVKTSAYLVIAVPSTAPTGAVTAVVTTFKAAVADSALITGILNSEL